MILSLAHPVQPSRRLQGGNDLPGAICGRTSFSCDVMPCSAVPGRGISEPNPPKVDGCTCSREIPKLPRREDGWEGGGVPLTPVSMKSGMGLGDRAVRYRGMAGLASLGLALTAAGVGRGGGVLEYGMLGAGDRA